MPIEIIEGRLGQFDSHFDSHTDGLTATTADAGELRQLAETLAELETEAAVSA